MSYSARANAALKCYFKPRDEHSKKITLHKKTAAAEHFYSSRKELKGQGMASS